MAGTSDSKAILPSEEWRETFLRRFKNFRKVRLGPSRPLTARLLSANDTLLGMAVL